MHNTTLRLFTVVLLTASFATPAFAQRAPTPRDIYSAAEEVELRTQTQEDATVFGGTVRVTERVGQDLLVAGGDIEIDADIGDDVRAAAGTVTISGRVGGDVLVAGGNIKIRKDAIINGDVRVYGGQVVIDGTINGTLFVRAGSVILNGVTKNTADVHAGEARLAGVLESPAIIVADSFEIGDEAVVRGDLRYWRRGGALSVTGIKDDGTVTYDETLAPMTVEVPQGTAEKIATGVAAALGIYNLLSAALVIALLLLVTKTLFVETAKRMRESPLANACYGLLFVLATPMVILFLFMTLIGIPLAFALLATYMILLFFTKALAAVAIAKLIEAYQKAHWGVFALFVVALATFALMQLLMLIPVLGWLTVAVAGCATLGALLITMKNRLKKIA